MCICVLARVHVSVCVHHSKEHLDYTQMATEAVAVGGRRGGGGNSARRGAGVKGGPGEKLCSADKCRLLLSSSRKQVIDQFQKQRRWEENREGEAVMDLRGERRENEKLQHPSLGQYSDVQCCVTIKGSASLKCAHEGLSHAGQRTVPVHLKLMDTLNIHSNAHYFFGECTASTLATF